MVEDGALGHKGHSNGMDVLPWPAQSPDLNLIRHCGEDMEVELGQIWERVSDPEAIGAAVKSAWDPATEERLEELIRSMPAGANGHPTSY